MLKRIGLFAKYYFLWVLLFVVQKPLFLLLHHDQLPLSLSDVLATMWHGLPLDLSLAGYVTVAYGLLMIASVWASSHVIHRLSEMYSGLMLAVASLVWVVDNALFPYWGYHLDKSLFAYLATPKDAIASTEWWMWPTGLAALVLMWGCGFVSYRWLVGHREEKLSGMERRKSWVGAVLLALLTALLLLPIRGSVTTSVMNTGRAYFSERPVLNSAAVNPIFSLMESLSEQTFNSARYTYMPQDEAELLVNELLQAQGDSDPLLTAKPKHVVVLLMESFSANAVSCLRGESGITPEIDRIAEDGLLFTNAYASGFRTDRGVVSVLSGFPSQPTSSLMTAPAKSRHLAQFSRSLQEAGYHSHFFYGGDEDFTNMRSYLVSGGFSDRVSDHNFTVGQRLSKWGVQDHILLDSAACRILAREDGEKHLDVVLTLSSHEPFDVPMRRHSHAYLNAIAYTDSAVGAFVSRLQQSPTWASTLLLMVADHGYPYPDTVVYNEPERYHILMLLAGGVLNKKGRVETLCQQTDLIPTLLDEMGLPIDQYPLVGNLFKRDREWAFYSYNDGFVLLTPNGKCRINGKTGLCECGTEEAERYAKAYMQCVYSEIDKL